MERLLDKLEALSKSDFYPYHMPGHKRNGNSCFALDITEIDGFDNLHHATGILEEAQRRASGLYGSKECFFLVNGSTCGLLTAIFASFQPGDKVLVARNCHKAVYHAIELRGIEPIYIYPETEAEYDINVGITARQVEDVLSNYKKVSGEATLSESRIKGMILTSPTYEGLVSEIKEIADLIHHQNMILIVDEAHGAHFGFHEAFPESAVTQGADMVIQSMHKTLPSMTQTALVHLCSDRVDKVKVQKYSGVFQTSSPSYVFMAYMDECIRLLGEKGRKLFEQFALRLDIFYKKCENLQHVHVLHRSCECGVHDPGKVVISCDGYSGKELYDILRNRFRLQLEMYAGTYVIAILTICDEENGFERLYNALQELDAECSRCEYSAVNVEPVCREEKLNTQKTHIHAIKKALALIAGIRPERKYIPAETEVLPARKVLLREAAGKVSKEYIYLYPPGIPFIVPGEIIGKEMLEALIYLQNCGYELQGLADVDGAFVDVVATVPEE